MINTKKLIIILLIIINLNSIILFSVVFYGTSETLFEKLTGKSTDGAMSMCLDKWVNISWLPDQSAYFGLIYSVDINVTNEDTFPLLNFSDNSSLFEINDTTGEISFTPTQAQAGNYSINVTVSNYACNTYDDSMVFNLRIKSSNQAPTLNLSSNFTNLVEDTLFYFNVSNNASDPDGDKLYYYDNSTLFNIGLESGIIAFIPDNDDVGNHSVRITISDLQYIDDQSVVFSIRNVNDAPVLETIGAQTAYINHTFNLNISAYDVDANENLTIFSNTSWFLNQSGPNATVNNYVRTAITLNFTNFSKWNGTYSINVTVNDTNGTQDSEVISFTVTYFNHPPNITSYYPLEKEFSATQGDILQFNITKEDPDGTIPSTSWLIDDVVMGTQDNFTWNTAGNSSGEYNVTARITDGRLDDAESWIITLLPPPPPPPKLVEGTSVGGGGLGGGVMRTICNELWVCTDWSVCSKAGVQTRECDDLQDCGTLEDKPKEIQNCTYVEFPSCFDGVQNQNEVLVDCGGVCKPCPTCRDGIRNQGEEGVDCGGPCEACQEVREPAKESKLRLNAGEIIGNPGSYWFVWFIMSLLLLSIIRISESMKYTPFANLINFLIVPVRTIRVLMLISTTKKLMQKKQFEKAKKIYAKAQKIYAKLPVWAARRIKF